MDARTTESPLNSDRQGWLQRERASGRFYDRLAWLIAVVLVGAMALSFWFLRHNAEPGNLLSPPLIALLMIANLLPAIMLMALYARRVAVRRAERGGLGSGRLHVRLVALFTAIATVPTVLVAIFASLLFQSGLEFSFSSRARGMLENASAIAQYVYVEEEDRVAAETLQASKDVADYLRQVPVDDPRFAAAFARLQIYNRGLSEGILFTFGTDKQIRSFALVSPYDRPLERAIPPAKIAELKNHDVVQVNSSDRIGALARVDYGPNTYIYAAHVFDPQFRDQMQRASGVLNAYQSLLRRARVNQLRFNAALLLGALVIVGLSILTVMMVRAFRGHFSPEHHHGIEIGGIYWHFVDVMWIVVYVTVYLL